MRVGFGLCGRYSMQADKMCSCSQVWDAKQGTKKREKINTVMLITMSMQRSTLKELVTSLN